MERDEFRSETRNVVNRRVEVGVEGGARAHRYPKAMLKEVACRNNADDDARRVVIKEVKSIIM